MKLILKITGNESLDVSVTEDDTFQALQKRLYEEKGIHLTLRQLSLGRKDIQADQNVLQFFTTNGVLKEYKTGDAPTGSFTRCISGNKTALLLSTSDSKTNLSQHANNDDSSVKIEPLVRRIPGVKGDSNSSRGTTAEHPGQLCRLCALPAESMTFIYGKHGIQQELGHKINTWLPTKVSRRDPLPKQVCKLCVDQLSQCQQFSMNVIRAESVLKELVRESLFGLQDTQEPSTCGTILREERASNRNGGNLGVKGARHDKAVIESNCTTSYCCPLCCEGNMESVNECVLDSDSEPDSNDLEDDSVSQFTGEIDNMLENNMSVYDLVRAKSSNTDSEGSDMEDKAKNETDIATEKVKTEEKPSQGNVESMKEEEEMYECRFCDESVGSLEQSIIHSLQKHGDGDMNFYPCIQCDRFFQTNTDLTAHYSTIHKFPASNQNSNIVYSCYACSVKFYTHQQLLSHNCSASIDGRFVCSRCGCVFQNKEQLQFHFHLHNGQQSASNCEQYGRESNDVSHSQPVNSVQEKDVKEVNEFMCHECGRRYQNKSAYLMHERKHRMQNNYNCDLCSKSFSDKQTLKEHLTSHMEVKPFQCHICGKYLNRQSRLKKHILSHEVQSADPQSLYCCSNCSEVFPTEGKAADHAQNNNICTQKEGPELYFELNSYDSVYRCEYCERCFASHEALNTHRKGHKDPQSYTCNICGVMFSSYSRVQTHKVAHNSQKKLTKSEEEINVPKKFGCDSCSKAYIHWTYLSVHRKLQHAVVKHMYKCKLCPEVFPNSWGVAYHRKTRHPDEEGGGALSKRKPFKCELCGRRYVSAASLQSHQVAQHDGENADSSGSTFQCEECGKIFNRKLSLDAHMRSHSGLKPYKCKLCPKTFVHPSGLSSHMRRHKGDKPHICSHCGMKFMQRSDCVDHERKHTGERPYKCDICGKTFRTRAMWFEHSRIHRDERPFPCDICGVAFRRSFALKNHRMIHTGERNFVCKTCHRAFRVKQDLQKHERAAHQQTENSNQVLEKMTLD